MATAAAANSPSLIHAFAHYSRPPNRSIVRGLPIATAQPYFTVVLRCQAPLLTPLRQIDGPRQFSQQAVSVQLQGRQQPRRRPRPHCRCCWCFDAVLPSSNP